MKKLTNSLFLRGIVRGIGLGIILSIGQVKTLPTQAFAPTEVSNWAEATHADNMAWFETAQSEFENALTTFIRDPQSNGDAKKDALFKLLQAKSLVDYEAKDATVVSIENRKKLVAELKYLETAITDFSRIAMEFKEMMRRFEQTNTPPTVAQSSAVQKKFKALYARILNGPEKKALNPSFSDSPITKDLKAGVKNLANGFLGSLITFQSDNALTWTSA